MSSPLLIDTDPGCDDAVAICLALGAETHDVVGITTVHGNARVEDTTTNALDILSTVGAEHLPVAAGCANPLVLEADHAESIHGSGGIRGDLQESDGQPLDEHGARYIVRQARSHPGELTIATLGPLSNLAIALNLEPELPTLVDNVVVMGGAAFVPGNVTPLAEANFFHDPHAAKRVVQAFDPTIIGLDVTLEAWLDPAILEGLPDNTPRDVLRAWLTYYPEWLRSRYGLDRTPIHDAVVTASLIDPGIISTEEYSMTVLAEDGHARGQLSCDTYGVADYSGTGMVATGFDRDRFSRVVSDALRRLFAD